MEKFPTAVYKRVSVNGDNAEVYITYNVARDQWVFTDRYWDEANAVIYAHATDIGPTCPNDMRLWFMEDVPITVEIRFARSASYNNSAPHNINNICFQKLR